MYLAEAQSIGFWCRAIAVATEERAAGSSKERGGDGFVSFACCFASTSFSFATSVVRTFAARGWLCEEPIVAQSSTLSFCERFESRIYFLLMHRVALASKEWTGLEQTRRQLVRDRSRIPHILLQWLGQLLRFTNLLGAATDFVSIGDGGDGGGFGEVGSASVEEV